MNNLALKRMTVPEFLAWTETQENPRYELIDGEPIAMAPERAEHVRAKLRAANGLEAAIQRAGLACQAFVDGLTVAVDESTGYVPDALVNCGEPVPRDSMTAPNPVIVVEVLSPSTRGIAPRSSLPAIFVCRRSSTTSSSISNDNTSFITASRRTELSRWPL
jgi:Uma2 family endonuclease